MPDHLGTPSNLPSQCLRAAVGHPLLWQEAAGKQLRQDGRIYFVRLDSGFCYQSQLKRVGDHGLGDMRLECRRDRGGVAGGLEYDFVAGLQAPSVTAPARRVAARGATFAQEVVFETDNLADGAPDIESYGSHRHVGRSEQRENAIAFS
jgi:hypothetical protein